MSASFFDRSETVPFLRGFFRLVPLLLAFLLSACETIHIDHDDDDDDHDEAIYRNIGAKHQPTATKGDWARHGLRLFFGLYPGAEALPDGHILPKERASRDFRQALKQNNSLTWFGHGTFLLNVGGKKILTDPTLARRIGRSPLTMGRMVPSQPDWRTIDRIDAVLITHADYDHLDMTSIRMLRQLHPKMKLFVPEGVERMLEGLAKTDVTELSWGEQVRFGRLDIRFVPAVHGTRRIPYELDSSLWGGYIVGVGGRKIYLSGDIAEGTVYRDIARKYGPVTTAIVPVGGYAPQSFNRAFHATPEGTVKIAKIMGAREIIASHWGTFALSRDSAIEQKRAFLEAVKTQAPNTKADILRVGQSRNLW